MIPQSTLSAESTARWKKISRFSDNSYLMCKSEGSNIQYAPLCIHSFRPLHTCKVSDAINFSQRYHNYDEIQNVPDRLRWCRYHMELKQKEVAEQIGISRTLYVSYETGDVDYYPVEIMEKLAQFYHIPTEDLLDDFNSFLYKGQGTTLRAYRESHNLKKKEFARLLNISPKTYSEWEADKKRMFKSTWENHFKHLL